MRTTGHLGRKEPDGRPIADRRWSLVTANVTTWSHAEELLQHFVGPSRKADVLFVQEVDGMRARSQRQRWQATIGLSVRTPRRGWSAGVAVAAKLQGRICTYEAEDLDKRHPGHFKLARWAGVAKGGIAVASAYGYTGDDAEARNAEFLNLVARQLPL